MRSLTALAGAVLLAATAATTATAGAVTAAAQPHAKASSAKAAPMVKRKLSTRAAKALAPLGELRGMALDDVSPARPATLAIADFPRMAAEGINSVAVYIYLYVSDPSGTQVGTGAYTPTDAELQLITTAAGASGLGVQFMPVLLDNATNTWRGNYHPGGAKATDAGVAAFFASYTQQVLHYADLAQSLGVKLFYVGSEQRSLELRTADWKRLISTTRQHFGGALSYLAIPSSAKVAERSTKPAGGFFNDLDLLAISPYYSLGEDALPTYDRMVSAWRTVNEADVQTIASGTTAPLIFGEIGYNSQKGGYSQPAAAASKVGSPAPALQADAYRALLDVLKEMPVYGITWWRWSPGSTVADMTFSPNGKPAECVIASHWSTDATVLALAALPVCDLHAVDSTLGALPIPSVG
jgi:hypothetical protein